MIYILFSEVNLANWDNIISVNERFPICQEVLSSVINLVKNEMSESEVAYTRW